MEGLIHDKKKSILKILPFVFSFLFLFTISAAERIFFKLGNLENLSSDGIKFKNMKDCPPAPAPMPEAKAIKNPQNGEKLELYDILDLWRRDQSLGTWKGDAGKITIGKIQFPVPKFEKTFQAFGLKSDYEKWRANNAKTEPKDKDSIINWIEAFCSTEKIENGEILSSKSSPQNCQTTFFKSTSKDENNILYIYLIEPKSFQNTKIVVCYECFESDDISKSERAITSSLMSFIFYQPSKANTTQQPGKKPEKYTERSPEYIASKEDVIKNIKNAKNWDFTETENFILVYNVKSKKTIKEIGDNLERCRKVFEAYYPLKNKLKAISVCRFFENRNDYLNYVGAEFEWTGGLWSSAQKELVISPVDWMGRSDNRKIMVNITYHEGFHQYIHYAANEKDISIWFDEGNAGFFEGINFVGDKFKIELVDDKLNAMKKLAVSNLNIKEFVSLSHEEFLSGDVDLNYTIAWGLMFFLQKGAAMLKEKNNYSDIPRKYYESLVETGDHKKANEEAWKDVDFDKLEEDMKTFWSSDTLIKKAENYDPLAPKRK